MTIYVEIYVIYVELRDQQKRTLSDNDRRNQATHNNTHGYRDSRGINAVTG